MDINYSSEIAVQLLVGLLKAHGIRKIVASPGSTNVCLVASLQSDPFFEIYSSVDERSAAYIACGLACESGETVALTCTEATASRNYLSGLTEAYYRKLPILAITATNYRTLMRQNHPQMIDRSVVANDVAKRSLYLPFIEKEKYISLYVNLINDAILELHHNGDGPVHIEYETHYSKDYSVKELPPLTCVNRYTLEDELPDIPDDKIAIIIGAHKAWTKELTEKVEKFCEIHNAVVLADHISNYHGKYAVNPTIVTSQSKAFPECCSIDMVIYIGDISSAYKKNYKIKNVWRVNPDGEIRNVFGNTTAVFQMSELSFFSYYSRNDNLRMSHSFYDLWSKTREELMAEVPELPFSNLWIAQNTGAKLPKNSRLFLGIENTLRCWNYFDTPDSVDTYCNTGGFGIDGGVSTLIGASLVNPDILYFGVTGDLAFFYDMNVIGNRHVGSNIRLCVINNAIGQQFKNPGYAAQTLGNGADEYVAAAGHYGNKSRTLLKHYAEDLGFEYISASNKEEFKNIVNRFVEPIIGDKSILLEVFTESKLETEALTIMQGLKVDTSAVIKGGIKKVLGDKGVKAVKSILNK